MKPTMRHMQAVSEEGSRLLGGASLHVPNLDVEEGGVANDLDGNAVDLAQASAQLRVVQEKSSGEREQRGGTWSEGEGVAWPREGWSSSSSSSSSSTRRPCCSCIGTVSHLLAGDDLCAEEIRDVPVEAVAVVSADDHLSLLVDEQHRANHGGARVRV
jgi:hypothetical protein